MSIPGTNSDPVVAMGEQISPAAARASERLYWDRHESEPYDAVTVRRDVPYGVHARQRLDVYVPESVESARPAVLFVHGGNFVAGGKSSPGSPYHDNVGLWAARRGYVGVVIDYRLAPRHRWPAGAQDVGAAVRAVRAHASDWQVDPEAVVLVGASAGAFHVATYLTRVREQADGVSGAALLSGIYDVETFEDRQVFVPYLGEDTSGWAQASTLELLPALDVPIMLGVAEHDPARYHQQASAALTALAAKHGKLPHLVWIAGHNHLTEIHHLNAEASTLDAHLGVFVAAAQGRVR